MFRHDLPSSFASASAFAEVLWRTGRRTGWREAIFEDDHDRELFLMTLDEACDKSRWQVRAFCLMSNYFQLVLETPEPNLVAGIKSVIAREAAKALAKWLSGFRIACACAAPAT